MRTKLFFIIFTLLLVLSSCSANKVVEYNYPDISKAETADKTGENVSESNAELGTEAETDADIVPEKLFNPYAYLNGMTLEEKVGQIFLASCTSSDGAKDLAEHHWGGYILFARDFKNETTESFTAKIDSYQSASKIPLLIAVDEEGGDVCRVSMFGNFRETQFLSPRDAFKVGGMDRLKQEEWDKSLLLTSLGINVNMAPVCDISTERSAFMYRRSLGQSDTVTSEFVNFVTQINKMNKIGSVLKHFPGYGNNGDTHTDIVVDNRPMSEFETKDLLPFYAGIKTDTAALLFSHTIVNCFDEKNPITLSEFAHKYVREVMGFKGVIVTDDMVMRGVTNKYGAEEAVILAVLAGNDLICSTDPVFHYNTVCDAVKSGRISVEVIDRAVIRVLTWKYNIGLIEPETK